MKNRKIAAFLTIVMILSLLAPLNIAKAAKIYNIYYALQDADTVLDTNEYSIKVGESVDFKFYGAPKNWKKLAKGWTSSNTAVATVDNKGVVTGKNQGTAYITVDLGSSCVGTLKINVGNKVTLGTSESKEISSLYFENPTGSYNLNFYGVSNWANVKSGAKLTWRSSDTKVVKVNDSGVVTPVGAGKAKISLDIKFSNGAVIESVPCIVNVDATTKVATEKELVTALNSGKYTKIIFSTEKKTSVTIPSGDYTKVKLVVDAPKADISNNGRFDAIAILRIASDTWNENATGNRIVVGAKDSHIVVNEKASVDDLTVNTGKKTGTENQWIEGNTVVTPTPVPRSEDKKNNINFEKILLEINGSVDFLSIDSNSDIDVEMKGDLRTVAVNTESNVSIKGTTEKEVCAVILENAKDTKFFSNVKTNVVTSSNSSVEFVRGAEGSTVIMNNSKIAVSLRNGTEVDVSLLGQNSGTVWIPRYKEYDSSTKKTKSISYTPVSTDFSSSESSGSSSSSVPAQNRPSDSID